MKRQTAADADNDQRSPAPDDDASRNSRPAEPSETLKPKEHGAYAILAIPIALALFLAGPTLAGGCVALASVAGFLAHEPLLVALGKRGQRSQRIHPYARTQLATRVLVAVASGLVALAILTTPGRIALLGCLLAAAIGFALAVAGKHRTLPGQLWGVVGLSAPSVPILLAGDVSVTIALRIWVVLLIGFSSTTLAVRGVIATQKRQSKTIHWMLFGIVITVFAGLILLEDAWVIAASPMVVMSLYLMLFPPAARHLKRVGWSLVLGTMLTAIVTAAMVPGA